MKSEVAIAQLSIVDGAWQESPDSVAQFDERTLFDGAPSRGSLYVVTEVTGEVEGRDALARELVETARREYAASRGSIMLGLTQAVRAANDFFYTTNANTPPEARRIAGMTAAILRDNELFIAQAGPGVTCLVRGATLERFPDQSPWFDPSEDAIARVIASRNFPTEGTVPIGMRRNYNPDQFHLALQPGDIVVLSTRTLAHLLSNEELLDTLANRHPDEIIASLEDLAGTLDLSVIALKFGESSAAAEGTLAAPMTPPASLAPPIPADENLPAPDETREEEPIPAEPPAMPPREPESETETPAPAEEIPSRFQLPRPQIHIDWAGVRAAFLRVTAGMMALLAAIFSRVDWKHISAAIDRTVSTVSGAAGGPGGGGPPR